MSEKHQRNLRMVPVLKETLRKIENDHDKTPNLFNLRRLLMTRIEEIERQIEEHQESESER